MENNALDTIVKKDDTYIEDIINTDKSITNVTNIIEMTEIFNALLDTPNCDELGVENVFKIFEGSDINNANTVKQDNKSPVPEKNDFELLLGQLVDNDLCDDETVGDILAVLNDIEKNNKKDSVESNGIRNKSDNNTDTDIKYYVEQLEECNCCCSEINIFDTSSKYISHQPRYSKKSHYFCSECVTNYFKHNMNTRSMFKCFCSDETCNYVFPQNEFLSCVDPQVLNDYEDILYRRDLYKECNKKKNFQLCTKCHMSGAQITLNTQYYECSYCLYSWCSKCNLEYHGSKDCYVFTGQTADKIYTSIESLIHDIQHPKCPTCRVVLQKDEGCNHMTCSQCDTESCYACGKIYETADGVNFRRACGCGGPYVKYDDVIKKNKKLAQVKLSEIYDKNDSSVKKILRPIYKSHGFDVVSGNVILDIVDKILCWFF